MGSHRQGPDRHATQHDISFRKKVSQARDVQDQKHRSRFVAIHKPEIELNGFIQRFISKFKQE